MFLYLQHCACKRTRNFLKGLKEVVFLPSLVQYNLDDNSMTFEPEGTPNKWCGAHTRKCSDCVTSSASLEPWDWCSTGMMTPRAALRLRTLQKLAESAGFGESCNSVINIHKIPRVWWVSQYSLFSSVPWPLVFSRGHDRRFSTDPLPVFSVHNILINIHKLRT